MLALPRMGESQQAPSFLETFDGDPAGPAPFASLDWDVTVHSRDVSTWKALQSMSPQHGPDCAPPMAVHGPTSSYADAVFLCRDHVMTAIKADGYGVIFLTPNRLLDFSQGEATLRFDVSTLRTSVRDWVDLWLSPYEEHLQLPLESWLPDLQGPPRRALQVKLQAVNDSRLPGGGGNGWKSTRYDNFVAAGVASSCCLSLERFWPPSATERRTFEIRLSRTHLKVHAPGFTPAWTDTALADLGWDQAVVQFGHHSYTPGKDCPAGQTCGPNTWHWDNVSISPAVPFTIVKADQRYVDQTTPGDVAFAAPAPAGASLRFVAQSGAPVELSFDGGATWQPARIQPSGSPQGGGFRSYWTPISAGVQAVQVRGTGGTWGNQWMARDFSVWAR